MNHQRRIFRSQKFNGNLVVVSDIFYFHPEPWGIFAPIVTFAALFFRWVGEKPPPMDQYGGFFFSLRWVWAKIPPHHYDESFCTCLPKWLSEQAILRSYFATWCVRWLFFGQDLTKNPYPPPKKKKTTIESSAPFFGKMRSLQQTNKHLSVT